MESLEVEFLLDNVSNVFPRIPRYELEQSLILLVNVSHPVSRLNFLLESLKPSNIVANTRYIETVGGAPGTVGVAGEEIVLGLRHRVHRHRLPPQPGLHHLLGRRRVQASQVRLKIFC